MLRQLKNFQVFEIWAHGEAWRKITLSTVAHHYENVNSYGSLLRLMQRDLGNESENLGNDTNQIICLTFINDPYVTDYWLSA